MSTLFYALEFTPVILKSFQPEPFSIRAYFVHFKKVLGHRFEPSTSQKDSDNGSCSVYQRLYISNEAASENVEYEVEGGRMLATFCHPRKVVLYFTCYYANFISTKRG